jgi:hypothetical protein
MRQFVDDDPGYLSWIADHSDSCVVNTTRSPSASYFMLYRTNCWTITRLQPTATTFTGDYTMSLSLLLETDIRNKVLKRAFLAAARVVAEQYFKDDGYLCMPWRVQLSKIFLAPPCRARLVRYVPLPHKIKLGAKRHWLISC